MAQFTASIGIVISRRCPSVEGRPLKHPETAYGAEVVLQQGIAKPAFADWDGLFLRATGPSAQWGAAPTVQDMRNWLIAPERF